MKWINFCSAGVLPPAGHLHLMFFLSMQSDYIDNQVWGRFWQNPQNTLLDVPERTIMHDENWPKKGIGRPLFWQPTGNQVRRSMFTNKGIQMAATGKPKWGQPTPPWSPGPTSQLHLIDYSLPDWFATPTPPLLFHFYFHLLFTFFRGNKIK